MRRTVVVAIAVLCGGVFTPALAQKTAPVGVVRDTDRDGVPDTRDRCPGTPLGTRVDASGCPLAATPTPAPSPPAAQAPPKAAPAAIANQAVRAGPGAPAAGAQPTAGVPSAATAPPAGVASAAAQVAANPPGAATTPPAGAVANPPAANPPSANPPSANPPAANPPAANPTAASPPPANPPAAAAPAASAPPRVNAPPISVPSAVVAAPARAPAAAAAPPAAPAPSSAPEVDPSLTEGFMMPAWDAARGPSAVDFARSFVVRLDSAVLALVERFRGVAGQPVSGATDPTSLSNREKQRWRYCRNIKGDLQTYADDVPLLRNHLPTPPLENAWAELGEKINGVLQVLDACEQVAYMIDTPDATTRFAPWEANYSHAARSFYADWYSKLRTLNDGNRNVVRLLNMQPPASHRVTILPLPATPPTQGATPR